MNFGEIAKMRDECAVKIGRVREVRETVDSHLSIVTFASIQFLFIDFRTHIVRSNKNGNKNVTL